MAYAQSLPDPERLVRKIFVLTMIAVLVFLAAVLLIHRYVPGNDGVVRTTHVALR